MTARAVVLVTAVLLLLALLVEAEIQCASKRILKTDAMYMQEKLEQDGTGKNRTFLQVYMPWHIIPSEAALHDSRLLTELAVQHPWIQETIIENQVLLSFHLPKFEWAPVTRRACTPNLGYDKVRFSWSESSYAKSFCEYRLPCNIANKTQEYGIDYNSDNQWGKDPRVVQNGEIFAPQDGKDNMDNIVDRVNDPASHLHAIPLAINYFSGARYPLEALTFRTCVDISTEKIISLVEQRLNSQPQSNEKAAEVAFVSPDGADFIPVQSAASETIASIWPIRDCLVEESDGICTAMFGYVSTHPMVQEIDSEDAGMQNYIEPTEVAVWARPPETFEPGVHRDVFRVRWFCRGKSTRQWIALRWTIRGSSATITENVRRCNSGVSSRSDLEARALERVQKGRRNLLAAYEELLEGDCNNETNRSPLCVPTLPPATPGQHSLATWSRSMFPCAQCGYCKPFELGVAASRREQIELPLKHWESSAKLRDFALTDIHVRVDGCDSSKENWLYVDIEQRGIDTAFTNVHTERMLVKCVPRTEEDRVLRFGLVANSILTWSQASFPRNGVLFRPQKAWSLQQLAQAQYVRVVLRSDTLQLTGTEITARFCWDDVPYNSFKHDKRTLSNNNNSTDTDQCLIDEFFCDGDQARMVHIEFEREDVKGQCRMLSGNEYRSCNLTINGTAVLIDSSTNSRLSLASYGTPNQMYGGPGIGGAGKLGQLGQNTQPEGFVLVPGNCVPGCSNLCHRNKTMVCHRECSLNHLNDKRSMGHDHRDDDEEDSQVEDQDHERTHHNDHYEPKDEDDGCAEGWLRMCHTHHNDSTENDDHESPKDICVHHRRVQYHLRHGCGFGRCKPRNRCSNDSQCNVLDPCMRGRCEKGFCQHQGPLQQCCRCNTECGSGQMCSNHTCIKLPPCRRHNLCVANASVPAHLAHGDTLGACSIQDNEESENKQDCSPGGCVEFLFDRPTYVDSIGLLNVEQNIAGDSKIEFYSANGTILQSILMPSYLYPNGHTLFIVGVDQVSRMRVCFWMTGAITELNYRYPGSGAVVDSCGVCGGNGSSCGYTTTSVAATTTTAAASTTTTSAASTLATASAATTSTTAVSASTSTTAAATTSNTAASSTTSTFAASTTAASTSSISYTTTTSATASLSLASTTSAATTASSSSSGNASTSSASSISSSNTVSSSTSAATTTASVSASTTNAASTTASLASATTSTASTSASSTHSAATTASASASSTSLLSATTTASTSASSTSTTGVVVTTTPPVTTTKHPHHTTHPPATTTPPPPTPSGECDVIPVLECTTNYNNGTCYSLFGYVSDCDEPVQHSICGSDNYFTPSPKDRGQPTIFLPGRQKRVFSVVWSCPTNHAHLSWTLDGTTTTASSASCSCDEGPEDDGKVNVTANLIVYRDRQFDDPVFVDDPNEPPVLDQEISYGLLTLDIPTSDLELFCLRVNRVQLCACDRRTVVPFDPLRPNTTGCYSPGTQRVTLYDRASSYMNAFYHFQLLHNPPQNCSGQAAFTWQNHAFTDKHVLIHADWTATLIGNESSRKRVLPSDEENNIYQPETNSSSSEQILVECGKKKHEEYVFNGHECVRKQSINIWIKNKNVNKNKNNINISQQQSQQQNISIGGGGGHGHHDDDEDWDHHDDDTDEEARIGLIITWPLLLLLLLLLLCAFCCCWQREPVPLPMPPPPRRETTFFAIPTTTHHVQQRKKLPDHLLEEQRAMVL